MTILEYKQHIAAGLPVEAGSPAHLFMHAMSQEAIRITMEINNRYHTPEELRALLSELWGIEVPESVGMFPPFNTDCGKNTEVGERTFINSGCKFQDQCGNIYSADGKVVGSTFAKFTALVFHPDFLNSTSLGRNLSRYEFFDYTSSETLHLSAQEVEIFRGVLS